MVLQNKVWTFVFGQAIFQGPLLRHKGPRRAGDRDCLILTDNSSFHVIFRG